MAIVQAHLSLRLDNNVSMLKNIIVLLLLPHGRFSCLNTCITNDRYASLTASQVIAFCTFYLYVIIAMFVE